MKHSHRKMAISLGERREFRMCGRKKKLKSGEANYYASLYNQRKYECPICGHWHLTKIKGE